jgi:hypothetical protein
MMRPLLKRPGHALVLILVCASALCGQGPAAEAGWTGTDPLGIPHAERLGWFQAGNLAPNPSFEEGTAGGGFAVRGWTRVGERVEWVDRGQPPRSPAEVSDGERAVRVSRPSAGESDPAEGILSDFIPVIPGNYELTYDVRLENLTPPRQRFGARLGDAVSVRLMFFDQDRAPLDGRSVNPVGRTPIDAGDKSYTFANYWSIDAFPWAMVRARTYNYPYSEGDIPDGARYVRLFFGLRAAGTMWVDHVVFRYSQWNFTALERLQPWLERDLGPIERLIPTPREIRPQRRVAWCAEAGNDIPPPLVVLPDAPAPAERTAAALLVEELNRGAAADRRAAIADAGLPSGALLDRPLVFAIGQNRLVRELKPDLPLSELRGREQGYLVVPFEAGGCHVVFLAAESAIGAYYAAATAAQLIDAAAGVYHSAAVVDYPDFRVRSYRLKAWESLADLDRDLQGLERMSRHKLNLAYAGYNGHSPDWYRPERLYRVGVEEAGGWCRHTGVMALGVMVNPYSHLSFMPGEAALSAEDRSIWTHGDERSWERVQSAFRVGLDAGARTVMLLADDFVPHAGRNRWNYSLYTAEDRLRFVNLQNAQAAVINRLKAWVDRDYPGTGLEFCPPWYANEFIDRSEGKAEIYFRELAAQIPADVAIAWTGPTVRSLALDAADLRRYRDLIGRPPLFWDNTLYARNIETPVYGGYTTHYPGKVRMCNLFEPFDAERPPGFHDLSDGCIYLNGTADSEIYRIKFATVADWAWNSAAYTPERALWKALLQAYGRAAAAEALLFNDAYYGLYQVCMLAEGGEIGPEEAGRRGPEWVDLLEQRLAALQRLLPAGHRLPEELAEHLERQKVRLEKTAGRSPA